MKKFNTTVASLSIAAAGVFAIAGTAKADSNHNHAYAHMPHTHTSQNQQHANGQALGNAIIVGGLLIGGIALLDALSNSNNGHATITTNGYTAPRPVIQPRPTVVHQRPTVIQHQPQPVVHNPTVNYTTNCRDHGHIGISWDAPREFSLRRPNGSVLKTIKAGRPVMRKVAHAMDQFNLDTTCVVKTVRNGNKTTTRFFMSNGRLPKVQNNWAGADKIVRFNTDNLEIVKNNNGKFRIQKPNGQWIQTVKTRKQARAFIAFLDEKNAHKKVIIQNANGKNKFAFYAR